MSWGSFRRVFQTTYIRPLYPCYCGNTRQTVSSACDMALMLVCVVLNRMNYRHSIRSSGSAIELTSHRGMPVCMTLYRIPTEYDLIIVDGNLIITVLYIWAGFVCLYTLNRKHKQHGVSQVVLASQIQDIVCHRFFRSYGKGIQMYGISTWYKFGLVASFSRLSAGSMFDTDIPY